MQQKWLILRRSRWRMGFCKLKEKMEMSKEREHIERICKEKFWLDEKGQLSKENPLIDDLINSIKRLSESLYSKDTHFIFELIQNAEDNEYNKETEPSISFRLLKSDPTNTSNSVGALIVKNNEIGFSPDNVDAICAIGKTTKSKLQGYIGEKGIGFKSVFRITTMPYIFSGGYQFCLPEKCKETGLGYIVPRWVDEIPEGINLTQTSIILPLNKPDISYEQIEKMLKEIEPETILFLSKLKEIVVEMDTGNNLTILKDDSKKPLVQILVEGKREGKPISKVDEFLLYAQTFVRPPGIKSEKRENIDERSVTIAFPLNNDSESAGKVFAYLPVRSDTGLPFLINADFLLTSSREGILESEPWNEWLRDSVPEAFVTAFEKWLDIEEYRARIFSFIPLEAHYSFFGPIVKSIQDGLRDRSIIPTEPDGQRRKPEQTQRAPRDFRALLQGKPYPAALRETRLVLSEIEKYQKQLEAIGVSRLSLDFVKQCFQDRDWVARHDYAWLLRSYQYLSKNFKDDSLTDCPIIPVRIGDKLLWSCDKERPIYFECDDECKHILDGVPSCARVPLAFLDTAFFEQIKDKPEICDWMTNTLGVQAFSDCNYVVNVLAWFKDNYEKITDSDFVSVTIFLSQFADKDIDFKDIPVLLADGRRMLLPQAKSLHGIQAVVTPATLDPETGWQNLWRTESDRKHFIALSDEYVKQPKSIQFLIEQEFIDRYPPPQKSTTEDTPISVTKVIINYLPPNSSLSEGNAALLCWLEYKSKDEVIWPLDYRQWDFVGEKLNLEWAISKTYYVQSGRAYHQKSGSYQPKCKYSEFMKHLKRTSWLPTTKGFVCPDQAFLPHPDIKEILGDSVPYFERKLPPNIIELLGIKTQATADELVSVLEQHSQNGNGDKEFVERVYRTLDSRDLPDNILTRLRQNKLIFVPSDSGQRWVSCDDAIWKDRGDVLDDDFVYLEKVYPKLKDFFVDRLQVKEDVGPEAFAQRWLKLQSGSGRESWEIENILTQIYREILPTCRMDEAERPSWWHDFADEAQIWTQNKTFKNPQWVYVPDDGDLKTIFQDADIFFAWRPEKDSFADWEVLYRAFGLPYLSESVSTVLAEHEECKVKDQPDFLTDASKVLIVIWLMEKRETDYQRLVKNQFINAFVCTNESRASSLKVIYRLGEKEVIKMTDSFWDRANKTLIIKEGTDGRLKNSIARTLARALMSNRAYKDLATWIELVLGEKEWQWRINQEGWQRVPNEVKHLTDSHGQKEQVVPSEMDFVESTFNKGDNEQVVSPDIENIEKSQLTHNIVPGGHDSRGLYPTSTNANNDARRLTHERGESPSHEHQPASLPIEKSGDRGSEPKTNHPRGIDYENELKKSFNRPGATELTEQITDSGKVKHPDRRREKSYERHKASFDSEPTPEERRKETMRTILEGPDEQVREYLSQFYNGKCQICGKTFPERDGKPFFIANYIVPKKLARFVDTPANALCLCADHFAKWQHGAVEAEDIIVQIENFKTESEGGKSEPILRIKLCDEECEIEFKEKHLLDLQELLRASENGKD
jgi:hypothetical protein